MKEPLLLIINYILKTKNVSIEITSIESFFEDGYSFPLFISKIFDLPRIKNINDKPITQIEREENNKIAIEVLFNNNEKIAKLNPPFETMEDKIQLLKLILTNQCFPQDYNTVFKKILYLVPSYFLRSYKVKDLYDFKAISMVLNILTNNRFPYIETPKTIRVLCNKCKIPFVINEQSLKEENKYTFLIQIQILFAFFACCTEETKIFITKKLKKYIAIGYKETSLSIASFIDIEVDRLNREDEEEEEEEEFHEPIEPLNKRLLSIQEKLKNFAKNIYDYSRNIDDLHLVINLWNNSSCDHSYYNGILIDTVKPKFNFQPKSNKKGFKSNFAKFFVYDEKELHWRFCKKDFGDLFQMKDKNQNIPLVLFMNSDFQSVLNFCSVFKKDILSYNFKNDISVFAFNQEYPSNSNKICFLFVYVPEDKIEHKNIQSILYQIYTFLFLICNETIIIFAENDNDLIKQQITFVKNIIKISDFYLKNTNYFKEKNINFCNHSDIIFFDTFEKDSNKQLEALIKENIETNYQIKYIVDIESFLPIFNNIDINFTKNHIYSKLMDEFNYIDSKFSEISELYIIISFNCDKDKDKLDLINQIIDTRFSQLFYKTKYTNDKKNIIVDLEIESSKFHPNNDEEFINLFRMLLLKKAIATDKIYNNIFINQLEEKAKSHLDYLKKNIEKKHYLTENQFDTFIHSHNAYLQKQLFEIIKRTYIGPLSFALELLKDILKKQIEKDEAELFQIFTELQNKKSTNAQEDFDTANKKGTNYVIKEVEKTREIEVMINSEEELENIIPQDF